MESLLVFAVIGLLTGTAARLFYPGRQTMHVLATLVIGALGGLAGGLLSWSMWAPVDNQFQSGNLLLALLGAVFLLVVWSIVSYGRSLQGPR